MFNRDNSEIAISNINRVNTIFMECKTMEDSLAIHNLFGAIVFKFLMITKKVTPEMDVMERLRTINSVTDDVREMVNIDTMMFKNTLIECNANIYATDLTHSLENTIFPVIRSERQDYKSTFIGFVNMCLK